MIAELVLTARMHHKSFKREDRMGKFLKSLAPASCNQNLPGEYLFYLNTFNTFLKEKAYYLIHFFRYHYCLKFFFPVVLATDN